MSLYPNPFSASTLAIESKPISLIRKRKRNENKPCRNVKRRRHGTTYSNPICLDVDSDGASSTNTNTKQINITHDHRSKTKENSNTNSKLKKTISPPPKPPLPPKPPTPFIGSKTTAKQCDKTEMDSSGCSLFIPQMMQHLKKKKVRSKTVSKKKTKINKVSNVYEYDAEYHNNHNMNSNNWKKQMNVSKLNNIHNINMQLRNKDTIIQLEDQLDDEQSISSQSDINFSTNNTAFCREASKRNTANASSSDTMHALQQQIIKLKADRNKYKHKYKQMKACAKELYSECVDGMKPRWNLIEFIDTEHKVTRDSELARLRVQISSLYPKGSFAVLAIDKWKGRKDVEESVLQFVKLNGEYRLKPYMLISGNIVDLSQVIQKVLIASHPRIASLNGQNGVKALQYIPKGTCIGQYFGAEILQTAFGKVFDGTGEEADHNIYAFDQRIDPHELMKLKQKQKQMMKKRKQKQMIHALNGREKKEEKEAEITKPITFIIDPFIGEWKNNELLLRFVNDCRSDIVAIVPTKNDNKYYNVEYVGMKVNGWPQTYLIARRDIKPGEELMTYYGTDFNHAITMKLEEEERRRIRKQRVDKDILRGIRL